MMMMHRKIEYPVVVISESHHRYTVLVKTRQI